MTGIEVQPVLNQDGEPVVELFVDQGRRWVKSKPVYLARREARQLAAELLEAVGDRYAVILDEELTRLKEAADNTTSVEEHAQLVMLRDVVGLMRRLVPESARD